MLFLYICNRRKIKNRTPWLIKSLKPDEIFVFGSNDLKYSAAVVCTFATFAAIQ